MLEITVSVIATVSLLGLAALIMLKGRSVSNISLAVAMTSLALIEASDRMALFIMYDPEVFKRIVIFLESFLPALIMFSAISYSRNDSVKSVSFPVKFILVISLLFPVSLLFYPLNDYFYSPDLQTERILFLGDVGYWFYMGLMIYCVISLVNLEATLSASSGDERWKMKYEVIGVIAMFSVLIFYYAQGLLYRIINMNLLPVRSGVFIIASILMGYSRLFRGGDVRIKVSRVVFYRSLALLAVGFYLLGLGLIGEGMRYFGVGFSRELTVFIAFTSGMAVLLVFFSEKLRRRVRVFISKHFYAHKYDYRQEWLKFTRKLSSCSTISDVYDVVLSTCRETFIIRDAALYLLDKNTDKYTLRTSHYMEETDVALDISSDMVNYFIKLGRVFNPLHREYMPTYKEGLFIKQTGASFIVPLIGNDRLDGLIVFGRRLISEDINYEDYDLMKTLARQAALSISNIMLSEELAEAREVAAMAKVSSFVVHDLKNLASSLSLVLDNADEFIGEPMFQKDMLDTLRSTVRKMKDLMQRLKAVPEKYRLELSPVDVHRIVDESIGEIITAITGDIDVQYNGESLMVEADLEELKKVVINLLLNAFDATCDRGTVWVETGLNGKSAFIRVRDEGCGIPEVFINEHLFKPFRTTKEKGLGIGLYQCKQIVEAHGGRIDVRSELGKGSVFTVNLPNIGKSVS